MIDMKKTLTTLFSIWACFSLNAQSYTDYLGAGHNQGVSVTSSPSMTEAIPENTFNGTGLDSKYFEASRFFAQSTMGHTKQMVDDLVANDLDFEGWIDAQYALTDTAYMQPMMYSIWDEIVAFHVGNGGNEEDLFGPWAVHFNYAYWQNHMTQDDYLRHRVAFALSQILVISTNSDLRDWGEALSGYYDLLLKHSFGNYRDLLEDVTYSFQMGYYLSHFNNPKADPDANIFPDENYAREIMQLFSIGLYELNNDGTRQVDENGDYIPTYDQDDIQEFAKIFTGLGPGEMYDWIDWTDEPYFGLGVWGTVKDAPMKMYEDFHETTEKYLLNDLVVPANQPGDTDVQMAIDNLFNHPNTGPFVGKLLIQRLVKSNPTPEYVGRVADAFNDNGQGVRGDMKAVIKAILLDEEARSGEAMFALNAGRAKEPMYKATSYLKMIPTNSPSGKYWGNGYDLYDNTGQFVLASPTVFNFYLPDYQPIGPITDNNMVAPEFALHNSYSALSTINQYWYMGGFWSGSVINSWEDDNLAPSVTVDITELLQYADEPEILINEIDKMITYGQLSDQTRAIIRSTLNDTYWTWSTDWQEERVRAALYYILLSPDFNVMK